MFKTLNNLENVILVYLIGILIAVIVCVFDNKDFVDIIYGLVLIYYFRKFSFLQIK